MAGRTRIAFLVPNLQCGGAERVFVTLLRYLDRARFEPTLVVGRLEGAHVGDVPEDVRVTELGSLRARGVMPALLDHVRSDPPDVVLATLGFAGAAALTKPLWPRRVKLAARLGNTLSSFYDDVARTSPIRAQMYRWFDRALYLGSDAVVCQSDYMLRDAARVIGLGSRKLERIHNPVDVELVRQRGAEAAPSYPGAGPHMISVGNLHWRKGYDVLLRAFARLRREWPHATLTILGEGAERPRLEALVTDLGIGGAARLPGVAENPHSWVRAADLFISPSRYEGFANVIVESLAVGTPVVATDCPSANRVVLRRARGYRLAAVDDVDSLTKEVQSALTDLAEMRGSVDALDVPGRFGAAAITGEYEALFARLASRQDGSSRGAWTKPGPMV